MKSEAKLELVLQRGCQSDQDNCSPSPCKEIRGVCCSLNLLEGFSPSDSVSCSNEKNAKCWKRTLVAEVYFVYLVQKGAGKIIYVLIYELLVSKILFLVRILNRRIPVLLENGNVGLWCIFTL